MLGGLGALAQGDVIGFLEAQQQAEENAREYSQSEEIKAIEEKRDAAVEAIDLERDKRIEAIQEEIDKRQEALEKQAEGHEAHMIRLQKERDQMATNASKTIAEMQQTSDAIAGIQGNPVIVEWLTDFKDKATAAAQEAAIINHLIKHPEDTVKEAFEAVRNDLYQKDPKYKAKVTATGKEHAANEYNWADGGYISGPGTETSDSIPARLSNGEYVIKASSVRKFGKATFDSLNSGEPVAMYADGGFVNPTRSGRKGGNPYGVKKTYYSLGYHTGQDYEANVEDDILAVADGNIVSAGYSGDLGNLLTIQHANRIRTYYAHLSEFVKKTGSVKKGDHVAEAGFSGNVIPRGPEGAHLHFEVRKSPYGFNNESILNPNSYLSGSYSVGGKDIDFSGEQGEETRTLQEAIALAASSGRGTVKELTDLMTNGAAAVYTPFTGRQFGGSMTMNKPYLVGENGPEVVMPYGSGSRVEPRFNVANASSSVAGVRQPVGDIINNTTGGDTYINLSVNGVNDPNKAAQRVMEIISMEQNRREFGRGN
jgi:murein DD-endopeptidase MepM/ murein hydrolase activator NlpD